MTRRYGRVVGGQRLNDSTPASWRSLTILGAVGLGGWRAMMTIEAATDTDVFQAFLEQVLCPNLKPGDVVVMDNLAAHKVAESRREDSRDWRTATVLAALLSGSQPNRKMLGPTQAIPARRQGEDHPSTRNRLDHCLRRSDARPSCRLLPPLRLHGMRLYTYCEIALV
jgi:DDE superfamily endonuclease